MKKVIVILAVVILLVGCGNKAIEKNDTVNKDVEKTKSRTLVIETELTNPEAKDDKYLVFLLPEGIKETEPGQATQSGYVGPYETDSNGKADIPIESNSSLKYVLDKLDESNLKLQVIVTTTEDIYMRNPLNKETFIKFTKNENKDEEYSCPYFSNQAVVKIKITDKYPDGVYSLTFPDASFVIKLNFKDGYVPKNSFTVAIVKNDPKSIDGLGMYRLAPVSREFQYWDTPFFKEDNLSKWNGTIIVEHFETNERIMYDEYPKQLTFDENGKCNQGNIVNITISK